MLPKFKEKISTRVAATKSTTTPPHKETSETVDNPNSEQAVSTDSKKSSEVLLTKKKKKSSLEEDNRVLLRDVSVLKMDFQSLKERVEKLELHLPMTSTPKKTPPLTSATSSVQGDGSKDIQHKHKQSDVSQSRKDVEITILDDDRLHRTGHRQSDDGRLHGTGHRQSDDGRLHGTGHRQSDDDRLHGTGHRQGEDDRQYGAVYRWNDPDYTSPYEDYYPIEDSVVNDRNYERSQCEIEYGSDHRNYERDQCEMEYMSDHSFGDGSARYGRDHVSGYRTHYVSSRSSSDYCRIAPLPSMASRSQPEKQLIIDNPPSMSSEVSQSLLLLKNSSYLESVKARSSSVVNFAAKLNCEVFSKEERMKSNVAGTHGKQKLDVNRISAIRDATFFVYPTDARQQYDVWKGCVRAIDEINRRLLRKPD